MPRVPHSQHSGIQLAGAAMAMPLLDFCTDLLNPRIVHDVLASSPPGRISGWFLGLAAPLALPPAPNRRCRSSETNLWRWCSLAASKSPGPRLNVLLEACGPSRSRRRVPGSLWPGSDGRSALRSRPSARAPCSRRQGGVRSRTIELYNGVAAHALTSAALTQ